MAIREEFFLNRGGIKMVLFAGLLEEAHQQGIKSIDTELIQAPTDANGQTTIVKARVEMASGATYSGIGDAGPHNVSKNIAAHAVRMAETRAKARALRDAINVSAVSLEEMDSGDTQQRPSPQAASPQNASEMPERTEGGATRKQLNYMLRLLPDHRKQQLEAEHGSVETWSKDAVRAMIDKLKPSEGSG